MGKCEWISGIIKLIFFIIKLCGVVFCDIIELKFDVNLIVLLCKIKNIK